MPRRSCVGLCTLALTLAGPSCRRALDGRPPDGGDVSEGGTALCGAGLTQLMPPHLGLPATNAVDVLFMIDNSSSPTGQELLPRAFPSFVNSLKALPRGLPDLHVAVVSSSLGAGKFNDVPGCPKEGDRGAFQTLPRVKGGTCTAVPDAAFIESLDGGTRNNFRGEISDAFTCIAELGSGGCGFEHQLASAARALGANLGGWSGGPPAGNAGFVRDDALLVVILHTDEDDCSMPVDSDLGDTTQNSLSDPLGPLSSYRCNEFGHFCGGVRPPRTPKANIPDCHSAEDAGKLIRVSDFVSFFKTVKLHPASVVVAAIAASPIPYTVTVNGFGHPDIAPSCSGPRGSASPAVRIAELVQAFGKNGSFHDVCAGDYAPALESIAKRIGELLSPTCVDVPLADTDPAHDGLQERCEVFGSGTATGEPRRLPSCRDAGPPCWKLIPNRRECAASGFEIVIDRDASLPGDPRSVTACCETCSDPLDRRCSGS